MGSKFTPAWIKKGFFNESLFCDDFLSTHQLLYVNGAFFTPEGRVTDTMNLRCEIFDMLRDHKTNSEERTIWDEKTMLAALQTIENPALHLAVHLSMILSLREGEILGLQPSDLDFDAADGRGTILVNPAACRQGRLVQDRPQPDLPHLPGQTGGEQVLPHPEKAQDQEIRPYPVYDEALEGRTAGMAGKAEAGRAERPREV